MNEAHCLDLQAGTLAGVPNGELAGLQAGLPVGEPTGLLAGLELGQMPAGPVLGKILAGNAAIPSSASSSWTRTTGLAG